MISKRATVFLATAAVLGGSVALFWYWPPSFLIACVLFVSAAVAYLWEVK